MRHLNLTVITATIAASGATLLLSLAPAWAPAPASAHDGVRVVELPRVVVTAQRERPVVELPRVAISAAREPKVVELPRVVIEARRADGSERLVGGRAGAVPVMLQQLR